MGNRSFGKPNLIWHPRGAKGRGGLGTAVKLELLVRSPKLDRSLHKGLAQSTTTRG